MRRNGLLLPALLLALAACQDQELLTGPLSDGTTPSFAISDAVHGGAAGFYFLPPIVPNPGRFTGVFDASASPEVRICKWNGGACGGGDLATFSLASTPALGLDAADENFHVNWKTKDLGFKPGDVYRIRVFQGATLLGYVDVLITVDAHERKAVGSDYVGIQAGKPLNIKFRVETRPPPQVGTLAFSSDYGGNWEIYTSGRTVPV